MVAIELRHVTRRFGALTAVDEVSLDVADGEIVGLLGHNGAGKTTLIRLINGLYELHGGTIRVQGLDPSSDGHEVRRRTGVLTEYPALDEYLTPTENLRAYGAIQGVERALLEPRIERLLAGLQLRDKAGEPTRELSAGLKQRVALARALVHDPAVLLLDEPTTNMDPVAARAVRELITNAAREHGRAVLLSTHNLAEAEQLCDRIAIIRRGRVLLVGEPMDLRRRFGAARGIRIVSRPDHAAAIVADLPLGTHGAIIDPATVELTGEVAARDLVVHLVRRGFPVDHVEPLEPTLEDLYLHLHDQASESAGHTREADTEAAR